MPSPTHCTALHCTAQVGVSLALSVIPEGLVAIVTLTMALGMKRMAKGNALVRQLPAVEVRPCALF